MRKLILGLISFLLLLNAVNAQDTKKAYKEAKKAFGIYNVDPSNNKGKLGEAVKEIDVAITGGEEAMDAATWQLRGEIYNEITTQMVFTRQFAETPSTDPELPKVDKPALTGLESFKKALELAEKKYETKDALKGLAAVQSNLYNMGIFNYEDKKFEQAYHDFTGVLEVHKMLKENGEESSLKEDKDYNDQLYITGLAALNAGKAADAQDLFQDLYDKGFDKPAVYEALYKIKAEDESAEAAYVYLEKGRELFPDDISLLFAEINHFLKVNKLDVLIEKLEAAITKEPENVSLYSTLGNVYDNLYQKEYEAGNKDKSTEYFNKAKDYYNQALKKDPKYFDAYYSIGALFYNKAAVMTKEMKDLETDLTPEGMKKYDKKKAEVMDQFEKGLPYFRKAEALNPNDMSTLIALREIYARQEKMDLYEEFNTRLKNVQGGTANETSYFDFDKEN